MNDTTLALICISGVLGTTVLIIFIVYVIFFTRYKKFVRAVSVAINNEQFCISQEGPCHLQVNDDLIQPVTIDTVFSYDVARYAADLVARVELLFYKKNGLVSLQMPSSLENKTTLYFKNKIIGYIAYSDVSNVAWVVFRGTANEAEWREDFNFSQVDLTLPSGDNQTDFQLKTGDTIACHKGFIDVFNEFKQDMVNAIEDLKPGQIVVTGHSLGAALATLASLELSSMYDVYTYCFASPRVCDDIPSNNSSFWRMNNTADIIPSVPLSVMPNIKEKNSPYFYTHGGISMEFTDNRKSLTNNHLLPVYINALEQYSLRQCSSTEQM